MPDRLKYPILLLLAGTLSLSQGSGAHGFLPDEIPMAAGTALRNPADLPILAVSFYNSWTPASLSIPYQNSVRLSLTNHSEDWHLFALGDDTALRDQDLIHKLMPDLRKDYPNTRLSEPGTTVTLPWRFDREGTFSLRCVRAAHQGQSEALTIQVAMRTH
ncbi:MULTISPECIES: hypothetical protein [Alcanivorax]|uniref:hypothetical protein n=1 Tax=Alcanivorax TaxID=59753 RepID=UPI0025B8E59A|nr:MULTISPECIES: hypothetical protein [Alcanivorax]